MDICTVAFFGHRQIDDWNAVERNLKELIKVFLLQNEYVDFLVGRNGEFDQEVSSTIRRLKHLVRDDNSTLSLILPYQTEEYMKNQESFENYYDEIEVCEKSANVHFKKAIQVRNRYMVDRADVVVVYIERDFGGAYQALCYARKQKKRIINIANNAEM